MDKKIICIILALVLVTSVYATCTVTFDKTVYVQGETATATMICTAPQEQSNTYTLNWTNGTGEQEEIDTGTTPAVKNSYFFESYTLSSGWTPGSWLNANLTGTNLEGTDAANVTAATSTDLVISSISISDYYINKYGSIKFKVTDSSGNAVANAQCIIDIVAGNNLPMVHSGQVVPSQGNGEILYSQYMDTGIFEEGGNCKWDIACTCFNKTSSDSNEPGNCYNSNTGAEIETFSYVAAQYPFTVLDVASKMIINKWNDNTNYDFPEIYMRNQNGAKVNISNNPSYLGEGDINFSAYDNTNTTINTTQAGNAYLTVGELAQLCFIVNNTFDGEKYITIYDVTFDSDNDENFFRPLNPITKEEIKGEDHPVLYTAVKSQDEENLTYERCSEKFYIPLDIFGANDWDVQAHVKVKGYDQDFDIESDEFVISGKRKDKDYITIDSVSTDKSNYYTGETLHVCGNVTNSFSKNIQFKTFYNIRCASSEDDFETDRSLILEHEETRSISSFTSQHQCAKLKIPHLEHLLYKTTTCYARVTIETDYITESLDHKSNLKGDAFNIIDYGMYPEYETDPSYPLVRLLPDWRRFDDLIDNISRSYFRAKINITDLNEQYLDPNDNITNATWDVYALFNDRMPCSTDIYNYTAEDTEGTIVDNAIVSKDITWRNDDEEIFHKCALGIEDVNFSDTNDDYFVVKVWYEDFEERQTEALENQSMALEGIESKTGTFHLSVDCPSEATIGSDMTCAITAYIEDQQLAQKEVDFTCYIVDNVGGIYSSVNFNQMITRSSVTINKNFLIPSTFRDNSQNILQCHADYYNLGSRRDSFYDSFVAKKSVLDIGSGRPDKILKGITGFVTKGINKIFIKTKDNWFIIFILIILSGLIFYWAFVRTTKEKHYTPTPRVSLFDIISKKTFLIVLTILIGFLFIGTFFSGSQQITGSTTKQVVEQPIYSYSILQDGLFRGIILTGFIILMTIILFKTLNIRGEIRFGDGNFNKRHKPFKSLFNLDFFNKKNNDYIELIPKTIPREKIKPNSFILNEFKDIKPVISSLREGNTIALVNIKPLKDNDVIELKRAIKKLKNTCDISNGNLAGFDKDWIIATPLIHKKE